MKLKVGQSVEYQISLLPDSPVVSGTIIEVMEVDGTDSNGVEMCGYRVQRDGAPSVVNFLFEYQLIEPSFYDKVNELVSI